MLPMTAEGEKVEDEVTRSRDVTIEAGMNKLPSDLRTSYEGSGTQEDPYVVSFRIILEVSAVVYRKTRGLYPAYHILP